MVKSRCLPVSNHQKEVIVDERKIFAIERPHRRLWKLYLIRSILTGPAIFISLPLYWFRYHTLRYSFDEEGIHMRWGILFRQEINLTYANIQDISVSQGPLQRLFGIADIKVKTAGGGGGEAGQQHGALFDMHTGYFRGVDSAPEIRDLMLERLRSLRDAGLGDLDDPREAPSTSSGCETSGSADALELLRAIHNEARTLRGAARRIAERA